MHLFLLFTLKIIDEAMSLFITIFQFPIDAHTFSPISHRVQNAFSIDKERVFLEEELKGLWLSFTFHL